MKRCRAVIFDLYYTLLYDTRTGTREKAIERAAAAGIPEEVWLRGWRAAGDRAAKGELATTRARVCAALSLAGNDVCDDSLVDDLTGLLLARQAPRLYPDTRRTLAEVRRRGYRVGLISNLFANEAEWLREFELDGAFDCMVLSCEAGVMKPDAAAYLMAADKLGVRPQECVFVDDVPRFLEGAKAVGMAIAWIRRQNPDEYMQEEYRVIGFQPDITVRNLDEFLAWLSANPET
jgi:putative hydrolase of the HAD superfamily